MSTYTEMDFRRLFMNGEKFDEWLKTEFLEVRTDAQRPGVWMDVAGVERVAFELERDAYLMQHPRHDLSAPVLPFPFDMADFLTLAESDCFKHSSARWPADADVEKAQAINPRTKTLMMELLGHMLPAPRTDGGAAPSAPPVGQVELLPPPSAAAASDAVAERVQAVGPAAERCELDVGTVHTMKRRADPLGAVLALAKKQALDQSDWASVWAALVVIAKRDDRPSPLLGYVEGEGVKYSIDNNAEPVAFFSREAWRRRAERAAKPTLQRP